MVVDEEKGEVVVDVEAVAPAAPVGSEEVDWLGFRVLVVGVRLRNLFF